MATIIADDLVGTWQLLSWTQRRGKKEILPMGEAPVGLVVYSGDGFMSVNIMRRGREHMTSGDFVSASGEEKAGAFGSYLGYAGTYELREDCIVHRVACASYPNWVGEDQVRYPRLERDTLTLEAAARVVNGVSIAATLVWRRAHA